MDCSVWFSQEYLAYIAQEREKRKRYCLKHSGFIGLSRGAEGTTFTLDKPQFSFTLPMRKTINDFCFHSILIDVATIDGAV